MASLDSGNLHSPTSHSKTFEKIFDEGQHTSRISLGNRKLKEFPKIARKYAIADTVIADLSSNKFSDIPAEIFNFRSLEELNCHQNVLRSIPQPIVQLEQLVHLDLSCNQLSYFPVFICQLQRLEVLLASSNQLVSLPEEIAHLTQLMELDVSCNEITHLPPQLGELKRLRSLNARQNKLVELPVELSKLRLTKLDISANRISFIPFDFHKMTTLADFCVDHNPLTSPPAQIYTKGCTHVMTYLKKLEQRERRKQGVLNDLDLVPHPLLHSKLPSQIPDTNGRLTAESLLLKRRTVDSGYSTADSYDHPRWSHSESPERPTPPPLLSGSESFHQLLYNVVTRNVRKSESECRSSKPDTMYTPSVVYHERVSSGSSVSSTSITPTPSNPSSPTPEHPNGGPLYGGGEGLAMDPFASELERQRAELETKKRNADRLRAQTSTLSTDLQKHSKEERDETRRVALKIQEEQKQLMAKKREQLRLNTSTPINPSKTPTGSNSPSPVSPATGQQYPIAPATGQQYPVAPATGQQYPVSLATGQQYPIAPATSNGRLGDAINGQSVDNSNGIGHSLTAINTAIPGPPIPPRSVASSNVIGSTVESRTAGAVNASMVLNMNSASEFYGYSPAMSRKSHSQSSVPDTRGQRPSSQMYQRALSDTPVHYHPTTPLLDSRHHVSSISEEEDQRHLQHHRSWSYGQIIDSSDTFYMPTNCNGPKGDGPKGDTTVSPPVVQVSPVVPQPSSDLGQSYDSDTSDTHSSAANSSSNSAPTAHPLSLSKKESGRASELPVRGHGRGKTSGGRSQLPSAAAASTKKSTTQVKTTTATQSKLYQPPSRGRVSNDGRGTRASPSHGEKEFREKHTAVMIQQRHEAQMLRRRVEEEKSKLRQQQKDTHRNYKTHLSNESPEATNSVTYSNSSSLNNSFESSTSNAAENGSGTYQRALDRLEAISSELDSTDPGFTVRRQVNQVLRMNQDLETIRQVIEGQLHMKLPDDVPAALRDGVVLCHLANSIKPHSVTSLHVPSAATPTLTVSKCRKNVESFLDACRKIGVREEQLCPVKCILDEDSISALAVTVRALVNLKSKHIKSKHVFQQSTV